MAAISSAVVMRLPKRNFRKDGTEFFLGIRKRGQPLPVERGHHFGRQNGIDANVVRQQFRGPFPGERHDRAFRRRVAGSAALSGDRGLRSDIDDRSLGPLQMRQSIVRHAVVMHQIAFERGHVFARISLLQADFVVAARIVDQRIKPSKCFDASGPPRGNSLRDSRARP